MGQAGPPSQPLDSNAVHMGGIMNLKWELVSDDINQANQKSIHFARLKIPHVLRISMVSFLSATKPIGTHIHKDCMEICYLYSGHQVYHVGGENYRLNGGDIFVTYPNEIHSTGIYSEEKSLLYYFIIDTVNETDDFLGMEGASILAQKLNAMAPRHFFGGFKLKSIFDKMFELYFSNSEFKYIHMKNLMCTLLLEILHMASAKKNYISEPFNEIIEYIRDNIYQDISIKSIARKYYISETWFKQKFKKETGIPPAEFIQRERIDLSKFFLCYTNENITRIAQILNFSSSQHYGMVFRKYKAMTPSEYRKNVRMNREFLDL